ncbi:hypothetical protein GH714_023497 [Hevea brasiliensis]|uniref:DM2 domain-containing protein n=1 Tax=Hevea brasiliensis TaxID=3981 RepID=A0A6A6LUJ2_HEVBR|nr:hypothetical protein GH714_023497 [Hevea brasiliensis]
MTMLPFNKILISIPFPPPLSPLRFTLPLRNRLLPSNPKRFRFRAPSGPNKAKRRGGPGGLNKLCGVSPQLETIVGQPALPRTEIVKQLWAYIRKNNLQDPSNKRKIICNDELRLVFETDCTDMFKMNKLLAKHIIPLEPTKQLGSKKQKMDEETAEKQTISAPSVAISEGLANFFGVGVKEMLQSEVFTRLWEYINVNNLETFGVNLQSSFISEKQNSRCGQIGHWDFLTTVGPVHNAECPPDRLVVDVA